MRVDDVSLGSTWKDLEMTTESPPEIVKTVDKIAFKNMSEMTICASGRVEGKASVDSDGKVKGEITITYEF